MKNLILDCGGVLVYPSQGAWSLPCRMREILGDRAGDIGTPKYAEAHRAAAKWLDESRLMSDLEEERRVRLGYLSEMNKRMGWQLTGAEVSLLADDFTHNILRYGFFDDIVPWLTRWREKYTLGILSDAMPSILVFMDQYGILKCFDEVVISTQVGAIKPDPRMYAAILKKLDAEPADCLFVDDRPCNLDGAVRAGLQAVQMARPGFTPEYLWDGPVVDGFEALNALMEA